MNIKLLPLRGIVIERFGIDHSILCLFWRNCVSPISGSSELYFLSPQGPITPRRVTRVSKRASCYKSGGGCINNFLVNYFQANIITCSQYLFLVVVTV